jgi:divalent metal cation (Fe/Co/Zn/Cd) transporter
VAERFKTIASGIPGVVAVDNVRLRKVGKDVFAELTIGVSRTLPIDRVANLKTEIVEAIRRETPSAQVSVTTEPRALDDETVRDRVMVIARNRALAVHHVTVHAFGERLSVSLDLEVDGRLPLATAHEIADGLEHAINAELGSEVEVETHIEPLQEDGATGGDASSERVGEITAALSELARSFGVLGDVHDVRVRETGDGEIVNFHCRVESAKTVRDVHEHVDELERALRQRWSSIQRVIGHAEPLAAQGGIRAAQP